ncbi:hypothetical protein EST38_g1050 [Candolleomyces aberdarensis]|uniref:Uncharacterized protein n=1 Tax=Candolleomyces aberdarensis TaxID=2316362 RepID=A0A4Q2DZK3_9AGAR|nr:hypothetical protein EST38_g1050 [Candolleomyces aberdarensis]
MPWFGPGEGLSLLSHLLSSRQLTWDIASELPVAALLDAAQSVLVKPALAHLFCDLTKTLRVDTLVSLPCKIVQEIIYVPTRTASRSAASTITPPPEPISPQFLPHPGPTTLSDDVPSPDFLDLIIPYSLIFIWFIGMISVFAFSSRSPSLSRSKRTSQASSSSRSRVEKRSKLKPLVNQALVSLRAFCSLLSPNPIMEVFWHAAGLLLLTCTLYGGRVHLTLASRFVGVVMRATRLVFSWIIKPALVNIFCILAKALRVDKLVPLPCDVNPFAPPQPFPPVSPGVLVYSISIDPQEFVDACVQFFSDIFTCIAVALMVAIVSLSVEVTQLFRSSPSQTYRDYVVPKEPLVDWDSGPDLAALYVDQPTRLVEEVAYIEEVVYNHFRDGESRPYCRKEKKRVVSRKVERTYPSGHGPSRFTDIPE